eukprot:TRINITY_DN8441_c0_g2_i1.p1 TRINITY_DN8441_c0_g2~~TRINITY_DN8441_c0_g2_i1.p1  ORF type:complete len:605 (-),score=109.45 TRINITY_DN8441_c0_g2_i1:487-2301(-)
MASAGLLVRPDERWGERKVYMRKGKPQNHHQQGGYNSQGLLFSEEGFHPSMAIAGTAAASDDSSSLNRKSISINRDAKRGDHMECSNSLVRYALSSYSKEEMRELKRKFSKELDQVRALYNRIEARETQIRDASYSASQFSGNYGGKEVTSGNYENNASFSEKRTPKANQYYRNSEFVTGKDKLPPSESKKGNSLLKRRFDSREAKISTTADPAMGKLVADVMKQCSSLLSRLMKHKHSWVFNTPVDYVGLGLHDYLTIIKQPMDLGTIKKKLHENQYSGPNEFAADVRLTFNNAMTYNPQGHDVHIMAEQLLQIFEEKWKPIYEKYEEERRKISWPLDEGVNEGMNEGVHQNIKRLPFNDPPKKNLKKTQPLLGPSPPPPLPKTKPVKTNQSARAPVLKKPKAKEQNKREMTYEEKRKLSSALSDIPVEKMENVVQIIRKRNPHLCQQEDEIEVDIDSFDTETLWELDRFVSNLKKSMSKNKKKVNGVEQSEAHPTNLEDVNVPAETREKSPVAPLADAPKKAKKGDQGEEDVDIDDDMPSTNFPPVEIVKEGGYGSRSSSSSSSSSDSGSSSSDSDSGSSSGSDSEGDDGHSPAVESKATRS